MKPLKFVHLWRIYALHLIAAPIVFMLSPLYELGGYLGWIAIPCAGIFSMIFAFFSFRVAYAFKGREWAEYGGGIVGRWPHLFFTAIVLLYCLMVASMCASAYSDLFISVYLEGTPTPVMLGCFLLCAALAARSGIRSIALLSDGFFLSVFATMVPVLFVLLFKMRYGMTIALFTHWSMSKLAGSTFFAVGWLNDLSLIFLLAPYFEASPKPVRKLASMQTLIVIVLVAYWLSCLLLFGPKLAGNMYYPLLEAVRFISFGEVLENLDPLLIGIWSGTLLIKTAVLLFMASRIVMRYAGIRSHRPLTFALTSFVFACAYQFSCFPAEFQALTTKPSFEIFTWLVFLTPVIYWTVAKLRGMTGPGQAKSKGDGSRRKDGQRRGEQDQGEHSQNENEQSQGAQEQGERALSEQQESGRLQGERQKGEQQQGEQQQGEQQQGKQLQGEQLQGEQLQGEQQQGEQLQGEQQQGEQQQGEQQQGEQQQGEQQQGEQQQGEQLQGEQQQGEQQQGEQQQGEQQQGEQQQGEQQQGEQQQGEQQQGEQQQGEETQSEQSAERVDAGRAAE
ncbi:GerAB/ArcD/ProY family transporter [Cohnella hashimotonis]|uniref:GerAB/ArcD/ProY family transporter n=1 Tax=Cohnella hashimotonis TaxID=2826895 RepID=A0ABT6TTX8_9BACL|nr:GerAB/ArcD/ProY family transporter [Cohnella hashimotonis]MDI4650174.1 GerAB/ArcD/ProY family transporter [Cohnella hashimotonis]